LCRAQKKGFDRVLLYNRLNTKPGSRDHLLNLWLYLWVQDELGRGCRSVQIRNTLVIYNGLPRHWMCMEKGEIKKKDSALVENRAAIFDAFRDECVREGAPVQALQMVLDDSALGFSMNILNERQLRSLLQVCRAVQQL
jgi:hypothetical protein